MSPEPQHSAQPLPFGQRLQQAMSTYGQLCVGIDPHPGMLTDWGLSDNATGLREFGQRVIEAAKSRVGVIKPQVAFFENYGVAGMQVLAELMASAKEADLLVIADAKRGDIGSTMAAYAEAWLNPEKDFGADAVTVSPYLGFGSLTPAIEAAEHYGGGLFVLALTSNPEGHQVQLAGSEQQGTGSSVAAQIVSQAGEANAAAAAAGQLGSVGLVVGATTAHLASEHGIDLAAGHSPILAPGYGAQGATAQDMCSDFGTAWKHVLVNSSRDILRAGPDPEHLTWAIDRAQVDIGC